MPAAAGRSPVDDRPPRGGPPAGGTGWRRSRTRVGDNERVTSDPRAIVLLGSTGSIGTQAIDIVRRNPDRFRVVAIGARGGNVALLAEQALALEVEAVAVAKASVAQD